MGDVFLDTNVLVSCIDTTRRHHAEAFELIRRVRRGELRVFISTQVIGEFYVSLTRSMGGVSSPLTPEEAGEEVGALINSGLFVILPISGDVIVRAVHLSSARGIKGVRFWDVVIVSTMLENGLSVLCTENEGDFERFSDLVRVVGPEGWGDL